MRRLLGQPLAALSRNLGLWHQAVQYKSILEMARQRVLLAGGVVAIAYAAIGVRLIDVMILRPSKGYVRGVSQKDFGVRQNITDRNGEILATQLVTASVYANPKVVLDPKEAAEKLATVFPEVGYDALHQKLSNKSKAFVWLARHVTPKIQQTINQLGIPGIYWEKDYKRVYPHGHLFSHVLGYCGVDGEGLSGIEKFFDEKLRNPADNSEPLPISLDLRIQHIVYDEMCQSVDEFKAVAGNAVVMNIKTGEILSMVSLPTFDPNLPSQNNPDSTFNRNTLGVYEPGSTFKILNTAIALESGKAKLDSTFDARFPIRIGRFTVDDFKGKYRVLSLTEAFIYSSNIAAIKIAQMFGMNTQKEYFEKFGLFKSVSLEIPEIGQPLVPARWSESGMMTMSYGYGISVTPLQSLRAVAAIVNNGVLVSPTLVALSGEEAEKRAAFFDAQPHVVSLKTSASIRDLMRMVVGEGTAKKADVAGYEVIGKTGTAYQSKGRTGYGAQKSRTTSFIGAFPKDNPQYAIIVMLDDPKPSKETYGYATAGWNAAPTAGKIISRIAPALGVTSSLDDSQSSAYWLNIAAPIHDDGE